MSKRFSTRSAVGRGLRVRSPARISRVNPPKRLEWSPYREIISRRGGGRGGRLRRATRHAGDCRVSLGWKAEGGCPYATLDLWLLARSSTSPAGFRSTSAHFLSRRALPSGKRD